MLRENRERARLKFLFLRYGWTEECFLEELHRRIGFQLDPAVDEDLPDDVYRDHVGIHPQKQPGYYYVGASVLRGRISAQQLRTVAGLADTYAGGEVRTTTMQNLLIVNVTRKKRGCPGGKADVLAGLPIEGSPFARGVVACSGTEFCKLAVTGDQIVCPLAGGGARHALSRLRAGPATEHHSVPHQLRTALDRRPRSRMQEDQTGRADGWMPITSAWAVVSRQASIHLARALWVIAAAADQVPDAIERLLDGFSRKPDKPSENLRQYFARHSNDEIRARAGRTSRRTPSGAQSFLGPGSHGSRRMTSLEPSLFPMFVKPRGTQLPGGWRGPYRRVQAAEPACGRRERRKDHRPRAPPLRSRNPSGVGSWCGSPREFRASRSRRHFSGGRRNLR